MFEVRYLRQHRSEGAGSIALALKRTQSAVLHKAMREGVRLGNAGPGDLCPMCSTYYIARNGAGAPHGMCQVCWETRKAQLKRQAHAERVAGALYEKEKKAAQRRSK